jgi:glyoxylase-like metal-dependent hydrolase (beta-lactamase superfamily II)
VAIPYRKGLHEIGDRLYTYLQPDGGYGWSNAGLVLSDGTSLLVDTLFDLKCTREMLESMQPVVDKSPIGSVINTHGDPDHCWGNQLVPREARIYSTSAALAELQQLSPAVIRQMADGGLGAEADEFVQLVFGPFDFADIEVRQPDETVDERRTLLVGGRSVEFIPMGPAHTKGDAVAYVPDSAVVFSGDIVFSSGTPVTWEGPLSSWLDAIDRIVALEPSLVVAGHGPVTDLEGLTTLQGYLRFVQEEASARHAAEVDFEEAIHDIDLGQYSGWQYAERIVPNVDAVYRELEPEAPARSRVDLLALMGAYRKRHARA